MSSVTFRPVVTRATSAISVLEYKVYSKSILNFITMKIGKENVNSETILFSFKTFVRQLGMDNYTVVCFHS